MIIKIRSNHSTVTKENGVFKINKNGDRIESNKKVKKIYTNIQGGINGRRNEIGLWYPKCNSDT